MRDHDPRYILPSDAFQKANNMEPDRCSCGTTVSTLRNRPVKETDDERLLRRALRAGSITVRPEGTKVKRALVV